MKLARATIGISLVALLIWWVGLDAVIQRVRDLPLWFVPTGLMYYLVCQLFSTRRWQVLLNARGAEIGFGPLFRLYMIGMFANNFLPGALGGDAVKVAGLYRENRQGDVAAASVIVERFLGLAALGLLGVIASVPVLAGSLDWIVLLAIMGSAAFIAGAGLVVWFPPVSLPISRLLSRYTHFRLGELFYGVFEATRIYWTHRRAIAVAFALSMLVQVMIGLYFVLTALATGLDLPAIYLFAFMPAITLVSLLPVSIGGLGVRELTMMYLFSHVGVSTADVLAISLIIHAINTALSFAGGVFILWSPSRWKTQNAKLKA